MPWAFRGRVSRGCRGSLPLGMIRRPNLTLNVAVVVVCPGSLCSRRIVRSTIADEVTSASARRISPDGRIVGTVRTSFSPSYAVVRATSQSSSVR